MPNLTHSAGNEEIDLLRKFLNSEFAQKQTAENFAVEHNWMDIQDPEQFEFFAPKGKLPFNEYLPWLTESDLFFAALWANFTIPGEVFPVGTMTLHEAWVDDYDVKLLFEICCEIYDAQPLNTNKAMQQTIYMWGKELNDHGDLDSLRLIHFDDGGFKFTVTNTRLVKAT